MQAGATRLLVRHDVGTRQEIDLFDVERAVSMTDASRALSAGNWTYVLPY